MPCYNAENHLSEAINSFIHQTYKNTELIIIDDGSTDNSYEICQNFVEQYQTKILLLKQDNKGPYPARNFGLQHAKGDCISFLDADDFWHQDFLIKLLQAIEYNNADIAYCGWQNVGQVFDRSDKPYIPPKYEEGDIVKYFLKSCPWPIHAALIKQRIIQQIGGFSERYFTSLDFDLWLRATSVTQSIILVPEVLAFYRWHSGGQISAVKSRQIIDAWKVKRDYIKKYPDLVAHLSTNEINDIVNGYMLSNAYKAYWHRDFDCARILFKEAFIQGYWNIKDLKYMLATLMPTKWLKMLLGILDSA